MVILNQSSHAHNQCHHGQCRGRETSLSHLWCERAEADQYRHRRICRADRVRIDHSSTSPPTLMHRSSRLAVDQEALRLDAALDAPPILISLGIANVSPGVHRVRDVDILLATQVYGAQQARDARSLLVVGRLVVVRHQAPFPLSLQSFTSRNAAGRAGRGTPVA